VLGLADEGLCALGHRVEELAVARAAVVDHLLDFLDADPGRAAVRIVVLAAGVVHASEEPHGLL
jgi:hypothetical protein